MEQNSYLGTATEPIVAPSGDEKTLGILAHALAIVFPILAPLIIYLIKKDESAYVAWHAKESLNFQITVVIIVIALVITIIGMLLLWAVAIANVILIIIASVRASEGKLYKYPFAFRIIK